MSAQSGIEFPQGNALAAYKSVFVPLSSQLSEIQSRKNGYGAAPYVKLQTKYETDVASLQINPYLISNNSYFSLFHKAYAGTKHLAGNTINSSFLSSPLKSMSLGYIDPWNCNRQMTAEALKTAITIFSTGISDLDSWLEGDLDKASLEELQSLLVNISVTLKDAKKTIFYIYRTYDQNQHDDESGEDTVSVGSGPEGIHEQYTAIGRMINHQLDSIQQKVQRRIAQFDIPVALEDTSVLSGEEPIAKKDVVEEKVMVDSKLVFKDEVQACRWFCRKLQGQRERIQGTGVEAYKNFMTMARVSGTVPQPFIQFAKSLDHVFKDKMALYDFVQQVHGRFKALLVQKGITIEVSRPDNFKMLLKELCAKGASREVYQTLFQALMNSEGNGPFGLKFEPAVLNAIMNNGDYFKFFDTEHVI